jgi:excisionase family DNA binding protein
MLTRASVDVILRHVKESCKEMQSEKLAVSRFEAARLLSISLRTLDSLLARGELRGRRVGRRIIFPIEELQRFLRKDHPLAEKARSDNSTHDSR